MGDAKDSHPVGQHNGEGDSTDARGQPGRAPSAAVGGVKVTMTSSAFNADCYNMSHKERGKAVIFNNKIFDPSTNMGERSGTDVDCHNLYKLFNDMGFSVEVKCDCTANEMKSFLLKVARENHENEDCFACAILSHGEEGYVFGRDKSVQIEELVAPFKGHRCKSLAGKPKLFFIQACRGTQLDHGVEVTDAEGEEEMETVEIRRIPTEADFLMAYSVVPGYFAWRNSTKGSWFVQSICDVFHENWRRMDLLSMMTRVCKKVAYEFESNASREFMNRKKQIPCITSMLTRDVVFTPKE